MKTVYMVQQAPFNHLVVITQLCQHRRLLLLLHLLIWLLKTAYIFIQCTTLLACLLLVNLPCTDHHHQPVIYLQIPQFQLICSNNTSFKHKRWWMPMVHPWCPPLSCPNIHTNPLSPLVLTRNQAQEAKCLFRYLQPLVASMECHCPHQELLVLVWGV